MEVKEIKFDGDSLVFIDEENEEIYSIREDLLADVMSDNGASEWIHQLLEKTWASRETLLEVASIIKNKFPQNNINWEITNRLISNSR